MVELEGKPHRNVGLFCFYNTLLRGLLCGHFVYLTKKKFVLNTCDKRINLNDSERRTTEKTLITESIAINETTDIQKTFLSSLSFINVDKHDLKSLYDDYSKSIISLHTSKLTGQYYIRPLEQSKQDLEKRERIKK